MKILGVLIILLALSTAAVYPSEVVVEPYHGWYSKSFHIKHDVSGSVIKFIEGFRGVEHVFYHDRYEVTVYIGKAFSWSEIEYEIVSVLSQRGFLGP